MNLPLPSSIKGLVTLIVGLSLVPALLLILYSGMGKTDMEVKAAGRAAARTARAIILRQEQHIENTRVLLFTLSQLSEIKNMKIASCEALFRNIIAQSPIYTNIRLCDLQGNTLASANSEQDELSPQAKQLFLDSLHNSDFSVQKQTESLTHNAPFLNCQLPIRTFGGTSAVLVASLTLRIPESELTALSEKHIDRLALADVSGRFIFKFTKTVAEDFLFQENVPDDLWRKVSATPEQNGLFQIGDGRHLIFEKLASDTAGAPALTLFLSLSSRALYEEMGKQVFFYAILLIVALCGSLLITLRLCDMRLISPMNKFLDAARRIKNGDLSTRINAEHMPNELLLLADSVNTMAKSIEGRDLELITMRDAANQANKAKTDFLANMSHEIRTPMNAILGMTYLAKNGELTDQQRMYVDNIHSEADKLLLIINDILDFSKIEAGKLTIEHIAFRLPPVLEEALIGSKEETAQRSVGLILQLESSIPPFVYGDPVHLKQLIGNVFANIVKAARGGSVTVHGEGSTIGDNTTSLSLTFSGESGIDESELLHLAAEDAETETSHPGESTRLKLTLTRNLLRLMHGNFTVAPLPGGNFGVTLSVPFSAASESDVLTQEASDHSPAAPPVATDVSVSLPEPQTSSPEMLAAEPQDTAALPEAQNKSAPPAQEAETVSLDNVRILLAEDNPINQQIAEEILTGFGAEVALAADGAEALELLDAMPKDAPYHVVLMDLQMPKVDGFEATARIRQSAHYADIPIIAMTAHSKDEEWPAAQNAGMNDFLTKPFNVPELLAIIGKWAHSRRTV